MKKQNLLALCLLIIINLASVAQACTIGVAAGWVTSDNRARIWKNRDTFPPSVAVYNQQSTYKFVGVANEGEDTIWMGVNEHGFAILNSLSSDLEREIGNGALMTRALGSCQNLADFEDLLDETANQDRIAKANMAVIDHAGGAAMYEISPTQWWKFDTADTETGYIVRANFAMNGDGWDGDYGRYSRANTLVGGLVASNNLNTKTIVQDILRDFATNRDIPIPVPFEHQWDSGSPWGFFDPRSSINNPTDRSAVCIEAALPGEPAYSSTMWTLLGYPLSSIAIPLWPVADVPEQAGNNGVSVITNLSYAYQQQLTDYNGILIDSYLLRNLTNTGLWDTLFAAEQDMFNQVDALRANWATQPPTANQLQQLQTDYASQAYNVLSQAWPQWQPQAEFSTDVTFGETPLLVRFTSNSPHAPENIYWDFDNDGTFDDSGPVVTHTYTQSGLFSPRLRVVYEDGETDEEIKQNYINTTGMAAGDAVAPKLPQLLVPSPLTAGSSVRLQLNSPGLVKAHLYNLKGQQVLKLANQTFASGQHTIAFNGLDTTSKPLPSGLYLLRWQAGGYQSAQKVLYIK